MQLYGAELGSRRLRNSKCQANVLAVSTLSRKTGLSYRVVCPKGCLSGWSQDQATEERPDAEDRTVSAVWQVLLSSGPEVDSFPVQDLRPRSGQMSPFAIPRRWILLRRKLWAVSGAAYVISEYYGPSLLRFGPSVTSASLTGCIVPLESVESETAASLAITVEGNEVEGWRRQVYWEHNRRWWAQRGYVGCYWGVTLRQELHVRTERGRQSPVP